MSTSTRASTRGGTKHSKQQQNEPHKNTDSSVKSSADKENKSHKNDAGNKSNKNNSAGEKKSSTKAPPAPTAEQLRLARLITGGGKTGGAGGGGVDSLEPEAFQAKVNQVMDLTRKSEEAVCAALAEEDGDVNRAVEVLLESDGFEFTSVKKKNKKTVSNSKGETGGKEKGGDGWEEPIQNASNGGGGNFERRGRGRGRGGGTTDRGGRPYRSRENKENENSGGGYRGGQDEFGASGGERGRRGGPRMANGPGARYGDRPRGGRGGGRGGGAGPRTYSRQGGQDRGDGFPKSIDTWNNPPGAGEDNAAASGKMETWGEFPSPEDWDNEEYTGSLADSKVFTPSSATDALAPPPPGLEDALQVPPPGLLGAPPSSDALNASFQSTGGEPPADAGTVTTSQANTSTGAGEELRPPSPVSISATLTAAQSQYLSQLTQQTQAAASTPSYAAVSSPAAPAYTTGTEFVNSYSTTLNDIGTAQQVLPQRSKAPRTRVPPPSKIPATAVEMPPGDTSNSAGLGAIDVQFGALDFGTEPAAAAVSFGVSPADLSSAPSTEPGAGGVGGAGGQQTQAQPPLAAKYSSQATDPIAEHAYVSPTTLAAAAAQLKNSHTLTSALGKGAGPDSMLGGDSYGAAARNTTFQELASMASKAAQDSYESSSFPQPSNSLYQSSKTSVASSTPYASQAYSSANVYSNTSNAGAGYPSSMSNGGGSYSTSSQYNSSSYVPSGYPGAYSTPSYQQQGSTGSGGYGVNAASQQQQQNYQYNNVGSLSGSSGNTPYGNSYQTSGAGGGASNPLGHKLSSAAASLSKDGQYESIPQSGGQAPVSSLNSSNPAGLSSLTQSSMTSSSSTAASNQKSAGSGGTGSSSNPPSAKSSNVASIPPGVGAPVVGAQYIMSSTGLPYMYNQPPMYNFEDLQLVPNRIPHGYYDLGFPPTSMGGRGEPSVAAYSAMSDARFARTDNNASPVPSSLSTQNATQAPLLNPPLPYAYYYSSIPSSPFSYSTPLYPQVNAGGYASTPAASGGSGGGKSSVGGAGGAGGVSQVSGGVGGPTASPQQGGGSASSADLMYTKSQHANLAKVNSYDKATFHHHTGTPPPYSLPGVGSVGGGMGPTGTFAAAQHSYAPVIVPGPQPPHHSTTLMHQPHLQDSSGNSSSRSQPGSQVNKTSSKPYYGNWNQN